MSAGPELILTDSVLNAMSFWCADYRQVTCTLDNTLLQPAMLEVIEQARLQRVLLAQRNTTEGDQAAASAAALLQARGIETRRLQLPVKQDANDVLRRGGPQALTRLIEDSPCREAVTRELPESATTEQTLSTMPTEPSSDAVPAAEQTIEAPKPALPATPSSQPAQDANIQTSSAETSSAEITSNEVKFHFDDRHYRVRGLENNHSLDRMKINLLVERLELIHVDTLDLYSAAARKRFISQAAEEVYAQEQAIKQDLGKILLQLEKLQEQQLRQTLFGRTQDQQPTPLSERERSEALGLLMDSQLLDRILTDYDRCGLVGEETNKLICYLGCVSRLLERPLAIMIQSSSARERPC